MTVITYLFPAFVVSGGAWHMGRSGMQCQKTPAPKFQTLPDICVWSCTTSDSSRYHFLSSTSSKLPCFCRTRPRTRRKEPSVAMDNLPVSIKSVRNFTNFSIAGKSSLAAPSTLLLFARHYRLRTEQLEQFDLSCQSFFLIGCMSDFGRQALTWGREQSGTWSPPRTTCHGKDKCKKKCRSFFHIQLEPMPAGCKYSSMVAVHRTVVTS